MPFIIVSQARLRILKYAALTNQFTTSAAYFEYDCTVLKAVYCFSKHRPAI